MDDPDQLLGHDVASEAEHEWIVGPRARFAVRKVRTVCIGPDGVGQ